MKDLGDPASTGAALGHWRSAVASALLLLVAACTGLPQTGNFSSADKAEMGRVYAVGFATITERALTPVGADVLAVEGLRGMAALDPALTVRLEGGTLVLSLAEIEVTRFIAPPAADTAGWATLTAKAITAAHDASPVLRPKSANTVTEAVFDAALSHLDLYSRYAGPDDARRNRGYRNGFGGIGLHFRQSDETLERTVTVTAVDSKGPAGRNGVRVGDRITHIDDEPVETIAVAELGRRMRGTAQSRVRLTLARPGEAHALHIMLVREHIVPETVFARAEPGLLILRVSGFNQRTATRISEEVKRALAERGQHLNGIVLDLRGNPGGLLQQSVRVADLFLSNGSIIATRGRHADSNHQYSAGGRDVALGRPLVVLVDGQSASASEVLASALQDRRRAVVVGTATYGKGTVQTVVPLPNGAEMTLTWSRLVTPGGYALQGLGVRPAVCTSGTTADGKAALAAALAAREQAAHDFAAWRQTIAFADLATGLAARSALRDTCPAERRRSDTELNVARALLGEPERYVSALDLATEVVTASRPVTGR